MVTSRAI